MFNQIMRIWRDDGSNDKDFTIQEQKLIEALKRLKDNSDGLSRASEHLLDVIRNRGLN